MAADATVLLASGRLHVEGTDIDLPAGFLAVLLATAPLIAGIVTGQLRSPVGFGRVAGSRSAIAAAAVAGLVLVGLMVLPGAVG
jgi:hypothetical protein